MWLRTELKERAKKKLAKSYWLSFAATLVASILGGGFFYYGCVSLSGNRDWNVDSYYLSTDPQLAFLYGFFMVFLAFLSVIGIAYYFFVGQPILAGKSKYFVQGHDAHYSFVDLFSFFNHGYLKAVQTMALRWLYLLLWTLLFIIPGIVKCYSYRMVPYLLAKYPHIGAKRAIALSRQMTSGEKMNMFILDLSFLGWFLLGALCLGVGTLFVLPYYETVYAELFAILRDKGAEQSLYTPEEKKALYS